MADFDLGIPDDFDVSEFKDNTDPDKMAKKIQDKFFNRFIHGDWKSIIKESTYQQLLEWFKCYNWNSKVVVRFKFLETMADQPFAIYCVCHPLVKHNKVVITQMCKPDTELFEKPEKRKFLLAIPAILRKRPLFCIPSNAIIGLELE